MAPSWGSGRRLRRRSCAATRRDVCVWGSAPCRLYALARFRVGSGFDSDSLCLRASSCRCTPAPLRPPQPGPLAPFAEASTCWLTAVRRVDSSLGQLANDRATSWLQHLARASYPSLVSEAQRFPRDP